MNASALSASLLPQDVDHNSHRQQCLLAVCERGARTSHDSCRPDILETLLVSRCLDALTLGHDGCGITNRSFEIHA
jgi:hypothetical protein